MPPKPLAWVTLNKHADAPRASPPPWVLVTQSRNNASAIVTQLFLIARSRGSRLWIVFASMTIPSLGFHALNTTKFRLSFSFGRSVFRQRKICAYQSRTFCGSRRTTHPCHNSDGSSERNSADSLTIWRWKTASMSLSFTRGGVGMDDGYYCLLEWFFN